MKIFCRVHDKKEALEMREIARNITRIDIFLTHDASVNRLTQTILQSFFPFFY